MDVRVGIVRKRHLKTLDNDEIPLVMSSILHFAEWAQERVSEGQEIKCGHCDRVMMTAEAIGAYAIMAPQGFASDQEPLVVTVFCKKCGRLPDTQLKESFARCVEHDGLGTMQRQC